MKEVLQFTQEQVDDIGAAKDFGQSLGIVGGLLYNFYPPFVTVSIGAVLHFVGYMAVSVHQIHILIHNEHGWFESQDISPHHPWRHLTEGGKLFNSGIDDPSRKNFATFLAGELYSYFYVLMADLTSNSVKTS